MPSTLNNHLFPVGYGPWYVYRAELVASPSEFNRYDVLVPDANGKFDQAATGAVVVNGFVIALEQYESGMTHLQVATPGSLVPGVAKGAIRANGLVKIDLDGTSKEMTYDAATAADLAAGKVIGRLRNLDSNSKQLRAAAANDIIHVQTGVI